MSRYRPDLAKLQKQCDEFNAANEVGASIVVHLDSGEVDYTTTRSAAEVLSGHSSVIGLEGIRGCYLLDKVLPTAKPTTAKGERDGCE